MTKLIHSPIDKKLTEEKQDVYRDLLTSSEVLLGDNLVERSKQLDSESVRQLHADESG